MSLMGGKATTSNGEFDVPGQASAACQEETFRAQRNPPGAGFPVFLIVFS